MLEILLDIEPPSLSVAPSKPKARTHSSGAMSSVSVSNGHANGAGALESGVDIIVAESVGTRSRKALLFVVERIGMCMALIHRHPQFPDWFTFSSAPAFWECIALIMAVVTVAIAVPEFGVIMSLLGAFSAFTLCVIGPLAAHIAINGRTTKDVILLVLSIGMGAWGTGACVLDQLGRL